MNFTSCQNAAFSNELFSLAGRLCSGRFSSNWANVFFAAFFILWGRDKYIDFLWLLFLVDVICPLMQEHFIWALLKSKALHCEAHQSSARRRHLKDQKTCLRKFIQIAYYVRPKRRCKSICEQSVFSPIGACIRIWCTAGAVEGRSQMFVKNVSRLISQMAFLILKMR